MSETNTSPALPQVGLPSGLKPEAVATRKKALIDAGTDPLLAEKLAIDAQQQQVARDEWVKNQAKAAADKNAAKKEVK